MLARAGRSQPNNLITLNPFSPFVSASRNYWNTKHISPTTKGVPQNRQRDRLQQQGPPSPSLHSWPVSTATTASRTITVFNSEKISRTLKAKMIAPNTNLLSYTASHLRSHLLTTLPVPTKSFAGQTILITGANSGIGLEAARYFVRLGASKVILGVRSPEKGAAAAKEIISSISPSEIQGRNPEDVIQVWELDLCRYASVLSFSERVNRDLDKLDVAVMNAGVLQYDFVREEENDVNITVNVVSTLVLGISLLPKLRQTSQSTGQTGILSFVGSFTHWMTAFPERTSASEPGGIFGRLADEKKSGKRPGEDRYYVSKLIQLLMIRELAERMTLSERGKEGGKVVVNVVNPGFVQTQIMRHATFPFKLFLTGLRKAMARSAEEGARTLVHAASVGEEGHGGYLDDCAASEPSVWVQSEEGHEVQKQLWQELSAKLEMIQPGIMETI